MNETNETTQVVDLGEATALACLGFHLIKLIPSASGKNHKIFVFETLHPNSSMTITQSIERYHRRKLDVDAYSFYNAGKDIKKRLYSFDEVGSLTLT